MKSSRTFGLLFFLFIIEISFAHYEDTAIELKGNSEEIALMKSLKVYYKV